MIRLLDTCHFYLLIFYFTVSCYCFLSLTTTPYINIYISNVTLANHTKLLFLISKNCNGWSLKIKVAMAKQILQLLIFKDYNALFKRRCKFIQITWWEVKLFNHKENMRCRHNVTFWKRFTMTKISNIWNFKR